jgi:hypothetical protein
MVGSSDGFVRTLYKAFLDDVGLFLKKLSISTYDRAYVGPRWTTTE